MILVIVRPILDSHTQSQLKWTSKNGPPCEVESGIIGSARILIREMRPISLLFPIFRKGSACGS